MKRKVAIIFTAMSLLSSNVIFANDVLENSDNLTIEDIQESNIENISEDLENISQEEVQENQVLLSSESLVEQLNVNAVLQTGVKYIVNINSDSDIIKKDSLILEKTEENKYTLTLIINESNVESIIFGGESLTKNYSNSNVTSVNLELNDLTNTQSLTVTYNQTTEEISFTLDTDSIGDIPSSYSFENGYYNVENFAIFKKDDDSNYQYDKSTSGYIKSIEFATLNGENCIVVTFDETNPVFVNFNMTMELWYKDSNGKYVTATVTAVSDKNCNIQFKFPVDSISSLTEFKYRYTVEEINMDSTYERSIYIDGSSAVKTGDVVEDYFTFDYTEDTVNGDNTNQGSSSSSFSSSSSSTSTTLDPSNLPDGTYSVNVNLWNASADQASMGNGAIYETAILKVENGVYTMSISTKPMTLGIYKAVLKGLLILNENGVYEEADVIATGLSLGSKTDLPSAFSFKLPSKGEEYIKVRILTLFYPEFPNHDDLEARIKIDWDSLQADGNASLTVYDSSEEETVTYLEDEATGIKITPNTETTFEDTSLTVTVTDEDETVSKMFEELEQEISKFLRYDITFTKDDEEVTPSDVFTVSIPVSEEFDLSRTEIYRLNDDNTLTLISYEIEDGYFVFKTSVVKTFIIVENSLTNEDDNFDIEFISYNPKEETAFKNNDFEGHYASESIKFMIERGILVGKSENEFAPNEEVTLATVITAISRIEGIDIKKYSYGVELNYYEPSINWAIRIGLISEADEPSKTLTREEVANIIYSYLNLKGVNLKFIYNLTFADDTEIDLKNKRGVYNLAKAGIISGREGLVFSPKDSATRAELSIILERIMNSYL